jgi:N-dimethylarginine dimethylaminohydrolase
MAPMQHGGLRPTANDAAGFGAHVAKVRRMRIRAEDARAETLIVSAVQCAPHHSSPHHSHARAHADPTSRDACSYRVAWAINPHMRVGAVEPWRAVRQHCTFVRLLERLGARVVTVPFVHGAYDSIFAKDNAVLLRRRGRAEALMTRPLHAVRRAEQDARARALSDLGFTIAAAPADPLEGGDVVILPGARSALVGHGFRSSLRSRGALECFLDGPCVAVELVDPRLYHLDMAVAVHGDGTALVCNEAVTPASRAAIARADGVERIVDVPLEEALAFGVNVVEVGRSVVLGGHAPATAAALERLGWTPHAPPLDQFHLAGGSAACLVSRLHLPSSVARSATAAMRSTAA